MFDLEEMKKLFISILFTTFLLSANCAGPPLKQIKDAETALNNAYQKGAYLYAAKKYNKAKEDFSQIQQKMDEKDFRKAKLLAKQVKKEADTASALTEKRKMIFGKKSKKVLAEAQKIWETLNHSELKKVFPELYPLACDYFEGAKSSYHEGDYYHARQKAKKFLLISEELLKLPEKEKEGYEKEMLKIEFLKIAQDKAKKIVESAELESKKIIEQAKKEAEKTLNLAREKAKALWLKWLEKRFPSIYEVKKGETLIDISAKKQVYGDPYLWPLLYKANRDQIRDPKVIFSGQRLNIPREFTQEEMQNARKEAGAPSGYVPPPDAYDPSQYQKELILE